MSFDLENTTYLIDRNIFKAYLDHELNPSDFPPVNDIDGKCAFALKVLSNEGTILLMNGTTVVSYMEKIGKTYTETVY